MKPIDYLNNANIHNYLFKLLGRRKFRKLRSAIENDQEIIISGISGVVAGKTTLTSVLRKMGCKVKEEPDTFLLYLENSIVDPIPNLIKLLFEESKEGEAVKSQISKEYEHLTDFYDQYKDVLTAGNTVESNYLLYRNYCETHNITPAKKLSFCKQMCRNFPIELMMKRISRETICRIWIGERKVKQ